MNQEAKRIFAKFPAVKVLYIDRKGSIYFTPGVKKDLTPIYRDETKKKSTNKKDKE